MVAVVKKCLRQGSQEKHSFWGISINKDSYNFARLGRVGLGGQDKSQKSSQNQLDTGNKALAARKIIISHSVSVTYIRKTVQI